MGQVLHDSATATHAVRKAIQRPKASLKKKAFAQETEPNLRHQPQDHPKMAKAKHRRRSQDRTRTTAIDTSRRGRSLIIAFRRPHPAAPLRPQADPPASHPFVTPSLSEAPCYLAACHSKRGQTRKEALRALPYRLFPYRHRRTAHRRGQTPSVHRHRPDLDVRLRQAGGTRQHEQWHPVCRSCPEPKRRHDALARSPVRAGVLATWDRAPSDAAQPFVDQRSGRAPEPHDQGGHRQAFPRRESCPTTQPPG